MNAMDTIKKLSPIEKIHSNGMQAIIDGDNQKIIGSVKPDDVSRKISELEGQYSDVNQDADGDIVFYRDSD